MLEFTEFSLLTDHLPLLGALKNKVDRASLKESRMLSYLSEFNMNVVHVAGEKNVMADCLSRQIYGVDQKLISLDFAFKDKLLEAQRNCDEIENFMESKEKSIRLVKVDDLYCENMKGNLRPFVPKSMRKVIFDKIHELGHSGIKSSTYLISRRYVWPNMRKDIKLWVKCCCECQRNKVVRHNQAEITGFRNNVSAKFETLNTDISGPYREDQGKRYVLYFIDRFSGWIEAIAIEDQTAGTICREFLQLIARIGVPKTVISDNGPCYTSFMFTELLKNLSIRHVRTVPYSPRSNGLAENAVKQAKVVLRSDPNNWVSKLYTWLLASRNSFRSELGCTPAEIVYGHECRLPGDLFEECTDKTMDAASYVDKIKQCMSEVVPRYRKVYKEGKIDKNLLTCDKVFVRNENRRGLDNVYLGPYKVIERKNTYFKVLIRGSVRDIKIDRLKTAYLLDDVEDNVDTCPGEIVPKNPIATNTSEKSKSNSNTTGKSPDIRVPNKHFLVLPKRRVNLRRRNMINYDEDRDSHPNEIGVTNYDAEAEIRPAHEDAINREFECGNARVNTNRKSVYKKLPEPWFINEGKKEGIQGKKTKYGRQTYKGERFMAGFDN